MDNVKSLEKIIVTRILKEFQLFVNLMPIITIIYNIPISTYKANLVKFRFQWKIVEEILIDRLKIY